MAECCIISEQMNCGSSELYDEYAKWAEKNGEKVRTHTKFSKILAEKGFAKSRGGTGRMIWVGIGLRYDEITHGRVVPINQREGWTAH